MKTKIILPIIIVFCVAVLIANGIYGNKVAKKLNANLKVMIAENELPVEIAYSEVKVNPLFSKVKITAVNVSGPEKSASFNCESLDFNIPYKEALRWTESEEFEEIKSLKLTLVNPQFSSTGATPSVIFGNMVVDFDGQLSKSDLKNLAERFPDKEQKIELSFSELVVNLPENDASNPVRELQQQFSSIDKGSYTLVYNPEEKELNVSEFSIESPVISYKGNALFKYDGVGTKDFMPKTVTMESDLRLEPESFEWEDEDGGKGKFELERLVFNTKSTVSFNNKNFPQGAMKIEIENLALHYNEGSSNNARSLMNFSLNNIDVKSLKFNYHLDEEKLSITDSHIESSLLEADISADVDVDPSIPVNSTINKAKVTVQHLAPDLETMLKGFEQQMGKELPRENGAIVLELSGNLLSPNIKGFQF